MYIFIIKITPGKSHTTIALSVEFLLTISEAAKNFFPSSKNSKSWTWPKNPLYSDTILLWNYHHINIYMNLFKYK